MSVYGVKTPIRRSPRLNVEAIHLDSTPVQSSIPTFNLNAFTPSPVRNTSNDGCSPKVVIVESLKKRDSCEGPSDSLNRKGKRKVDLPHDSDFEDEIPIMKRFRKDHELECADVTCKSGGVARGKDVNPKVMKHRKGRGKGLKKTSKDKVKISRWLSYTNFDVFGEITERLSKLNMIDMFK